MRVLFLGAVAEDTFRYEPVRVRTITPVRAVSASGGGYLCMLDVLDEVTCTRATARHRPAIEGLAGVREISVDDHSLCALLPSGKVTCSGDRNDLGMDDEAGSHRRGRSRQALVRRAQHHLRAARRWRGPLLGGDVFRQLRPPPKLHGPR